MAEFLIDVLDKDAVDGTDEDLLRAKLRQVFTPNFDTIADVASVSLIDARCVIAAGQLWDYVTTGSYDGIWILQDADGRLYKRVSGFRWLETKTVSGPQATVDFIGLDGLLDLVVLIEGVSSDGTPIGMLLQTSADNGGSFAATGYISQGQFFGSASMTAQNATAGIQVLGGNTALAAADTIHGTIDIIGLGSAAFRTQAKGQGYSSGSARGIAGAGAYATARAENAIRFLWTSGNIDIGAFHLFARG